MPKCKNCGTRLTKFDKDICPVCGTKNPLEGVSSETIEITSQLDISKEEFKNFHPTKRIVAFSYFTLLGWSGAGYCYLKLKMVALIWLLCNLAIFGGLFAILFTAAKMDVSWSILIPVFVLYGINIIVGFFVLLKKDLKDGNGEFLR